MIPSLYFEKTLRSNNLIIGAPIKVNQNNGRYAWHRVTDVYVWYFGIEEARVTIFTVELDKDFKDAGFHYWNQETLKKRMELITVEDKEFGFIIYGATAWEHNVLESFFEEFWVHVN